jgi:hypothetical protein
MNPSTSRIFHIYTILNLNVTPFLFKGGFFAIFFLGIGGFDWVRMPKLQTYGEANLYLPFAPHIPPSFQSSLVPSF